VRLQTSRLILRPPSPDDAADALEMLHDPEVVQWNPAPAVTDLESAREWCVRGGDWSSGDHATWHAMSESGRLMANVSLFELDAEHRSAKVGYRVAPWARCQGIATEALRAVCDWAFSEREIDRIELDHVVVNVASCRVALAAGFVYEGLLRSSYLGADGIRYDDHVHGRLPGDPVPAAESAPDLPA
jgi:RimJ/RimL family protein N-acetyltransferase